MVRCALNPRSLKQCTTEATSNYVWINDDFLQSQWRKFTSRVISTSSDGSQRQYSHLARSKHKPHPSLYKTPNGYLSRPGTSEASPSYCGCRYGSSAPGPLEARERKALKRRIVGVAQPGSFGELETGILASLGTSKFVLEPQRSAFIDGDKNQSFSDIQSVVPGMYNIMYNYLAYKN
jgi:hypothetical protein